MRIHSDLDLLRRKNDGLVYKIVATLNPGIFVAPVRPLAPGLVIEYGPRIGPLHALNEEEWSNAALSDAPDYVL